jgi:hypothetical protein
MELVVDPAVIFLDEPTSGLDAFTAFRVGGGGGRGSLGDGSDRGRGKRGTVGEEGKSGGEYGGSGRRGRILFGMRRQCSCIKMPVFPVTRVSLYPRSGKRSVSPVI